VKDVIVEGPDGAGKSTLVSHLVKTLGFTLHEKASRSIEGPMPELARWIDESLMYDRQADEWFVHDRHPIISEPIYGPIVRGITQRPFQNGQYLMNVRDILQLDSVVVWCLPDLGAVSRNVAANARDQMPGVLNNIGKVHQAYMTAYFRWRGPKLQYDYRRHDLIWFTEQLEKMVKG
jgi:hypothetical protein